MRHSLALVIALLAWSCGRTASPPAPVAAGDQELERTAELVAEAQPRLAAEYAQRTWDLAAQIAEAADLAELRSTTLPAGEREVRLLMLGYGMWGVPQLYRITRDRAGDVRGEIVLWWPTGQEDRPAGEALDDYMRARHAGRCGDFVRHDPLGTCRVRFVRPPEWRLILERAETAGLWRLLDGPPVAQYLPNVLGTGIYSVTVEVREGDRYSARHYTTPSSADGADQGRVAALLLKLRGLDSLAVPRDVVRPYRGLVTLRAYRPSFQPCGADSAWELMHGLEADVTRAGIRLPLVAGDSVSRLYVEVSGEATPGWHARRRGSPYARQFFVDSLLVVTPWTGGECQ